MASNPNSGSNTPNPRFAASSKTAEDLLANQTVGLVALSDFRKRRAEALDQKDRDAHEKAVGGKGAVASSKAASGTSQPSEPAKKKKKVKAGTPKLSFGMDDEDGEDSAVSVDSKSASKANSKSNTATPERANTPAGSEETRAKIKANTSVATLPKALTKAALLREAQERETLRKEFLALQEAVKASEIAIPFVFYDGTNIPGGVVSVKKGDFMWVFLDKSRKVGAELGVGSDGEGKARREWARVGVDDLMIVRGEIIIPHHYDFYYFIMNRSIGPHNRLLFDYSSQPPPASEQNNSNPSTPNAEPYNPLSRPSKSKASSSNNGAKIADLEGAKDDPTFTKVVDRRWYERNKHIFPASVWQEFDPEKDYRKEVKRDAGGNAFFFS